jgi:hypothetical protein
MLLDQGAFLGHGIMTCLAHAFRALPIGPVLFVRGPYGKGHTSKRFCGDIAFLRGLE